MKHYTKYVSVDDSFGLDDIESGAGTSPREDATLFSWLVLVSVKTDQVATLWYYVKQSLHMTWLMSCR